MAVIPHTMWRFFDKSLPDEFWLEASLGLMFKCDGVILVPSWRQSVGACAEKESAEAAGIPVFEGLSDLITHDWEKSDD